jgi:Ni,Fe-hydrogenase III small subunit
VANWVWKGLTSGIKSTAYPVRAELAAGVTPGRPVAAAQLTLPAEELAARCPTDAISPSESGVAIDQGRCVHCRRCQADADHAGLPWRDNYEWAAFPDMEAAQHELQRVFGRSLHIRFLDAGACGACMSEARQLNNPYYNIHRLGFFMTPTPRNADVLMVAGPVSDAMRFPLQSTYAAMPTPKRVIAIGACAISGGVFGPSFAASGGLDEILPVDVMVPGCPPPPLAILHALLVVVKRKPPASLISRPEEVSA